MMKFLMYYRLTLFSLPFLALLFFISCNDNSDDPEEVTADFTYTTTNISAGESITFTDVSVGDIESRSWTFDGGTPETSTESNPTVIYDQAGTFSVTLSILGSSSSDIKEEENLVIVTESLTQTDFSANITSLKEGESVSFSDMSAEGATAWNWTFEGGTPGTSNEQNPTVEYGSEGAYDVTLEVTFASGSNSETKEDYITVSVDDGSGLIAYYPFNGNANDESGNGVDGTVSGAAPVSDRNGTANSAYEFDGSDEDFIEVPLAFPTGAFTIAFWVLSKGEGYNNFESFLEFGTRLEESYIIDAPYIGTWDGNLGFPAFYIGVAEGASVSDFFFGRSTEDGILKDAWQFITYVYDPQGTLTLYIDGISEDINPAVPTETLFSEGLKAPGTNLFIGNSGSGGAGFTGLLDDIRVYERALNEDQVLELFNE